MCLVGLEVQDRSLRCGLKAGEAGSRAVEKEGGGSSSPGVDTRVPLAPSGLGSVTAVAAARTSGLRRLPLRVFSHPGFTFKV